MQAYVPVFLIISFLRTDFSACSTAITHTIPMRLASTREGANSREHEKHKTPKKDAVWQPEFEGSTETRV